MEHNLLQKSCAHFQQGFEQPNREKREFKQAKIPNYNNSCIEAFGFLDLINCLHNANSAFFYGVIRHAKMKQDLLQQPSEYSCLPEKKIPGL